jgi:hypothetical protein
MQMDRIEFGRWIGAAPCPRFGFEHAFVHPCADVVRCYRQAVIRNLAFLYVVVAPFLLGSWRKALASAIRQKETLRVTFESEAEVMPHVLLTIVGW